MPGDELSKDELHEALCAPVGMLRFTCSHPEIFSADSAGVLFERVAGQHYFRIERFPQLELKFFHSSPGVGTRVAAISLSNLPKADSIEVGLRWSPEETGLFVRPVVDGIEGVRAAGIPSDVQYQITTDGQVVAIGGPTVEVRSVRITRNGQAILEPPALDAWRDTLKGIEILWNTSSSLDFQYQNVRTNLTIVMLVAGFEAYAKRRFLELQLEGINPNLASLITTFYSRRVKEHGYDAVEDDITEEGKANNRSLLAQIARDLNFQSIDQCKNAYKKAYGIRFGDIPECHCLIEDLRTFLRFRHRIVHVSPVLAILATPGDELGTQELVFADASTGVFARETFSAFVDGLHAATLKLSSR